MRIKTSTGITLDTNKGMAQSLTDYAVKKSVENAIVFYVDESPASYLLVVNNIPEFESQKAEDVAVHIDILALAQMEGLK